MASPDRVFVIEQIDKKKPLNTIGLVDPRLFKDGEEGNKLHAVMDEHSCLWTMKYEKGGIPDGLKGQFTGFKALKKFAEEYFAKRNIKITEVR